MPGTRITFADASQLWIPTDETSAELLDRFQSKLRAFHKHPDKPCCGCSHEARPLRVTIRRLPSDRFILARMPREGPRHQESCSFHAVDAEQSGRAGYAGGVIEEAADGGIGRVARSHNWRTLLPGTVSFSRSGRSSGVRTPASG